MNGALYTKKKVTKCDICTYWNGTGVSTMRSHEVSAASTRSHSR